MAKTEINRDSSGARVSAAVNIIIIISRWPASVKRSDDSDNKSTLVRKQRATDGQRDWSVGHGRSKWLENANKQQLAKHNNLMQI